MRDFDKAGVNFKVRMSEYTQKNRNVIILGFDDKQEGYELASLLFLNSILVPCLTQLCSEEIEKALTKQDRLSLRTNQEGSIRSAVLLVIFVEIKNSKYVYATASLYCNIIILLHYRIMTYSRLTCCTTSL